MKINVLKLCVFLALFFTIERFCHKQTHGFRLYKIQSDHENHPDWDVKPPRNINLDTILSQPYYFLNSGGECYAFVSKDQKYVIKFFKHHHMRANRWYDLLPLPIFLQTRTKRREKLSTLFTSCKIAEKRFKKQTGLLYLHLNQTKNLQKKIQLFDAIGAVHYLDLDPTSFAIQKKATLAYPTLTHLMQAGEIQAAKVRLESLIQLMIARSKAGVADHDPRKRNFGFVQDQAIEIDLGSFEIKESLKNPKESRRALYYETLKLRKWIKKYHPELSPVLEEILKSTQNDLVKYTENN